MLVLSICEDPDFLMIIYSFKIIIELIMVIVPMVLIITIMLDVAKSITQSSEEIPKVLMKSKNRIVAAVVIFFVPIIVNSVINLISSNDMSIACIQKANLANINALKAIINAEQAQSSKGGTDPVIEKPSNMPTSKRAIPFVNGTQRTLSNGDCMYFSDNCLCPTIGNYTGFSFSMENSTSRKFADVKGGDSFVRVKVTCSDGTTISKMVNEKAVSNFQQAFEKICLLKTTGINEIKIDADDLYIDGTLVKRLSSSRSLCSKHAYGIAIDINYNYVYKINDKTYKPYSSQGNKTRIEYDKFVEALGSESDPRNVNYILWKYVFAPSGFNWGGNWNDEYFDPMHFELP